MRSVAKLVVAAALGSVIAVGALAQPAFAPARPESLAIVQQFERPLAAGIASALDAHGLADAGVKWLKVYVDNMGRGPAVGYDVVVAVEQRRSLVGIRLDTFGDPIAVFPLAGSEQLPPRR